MLYEKGIKCPCCGHTRDTYDFLRYLYNREMKEIKDGINCEKCGKVFNMYLGTKCKSNYTNTKTTKYKEERERFINKGK